MLNDATRDFIRQHADDDVRRLALRSSKDAAVDMVLALQQIAGRQTARWKLPAWAATEGIVYPPHLNMEQCSSEQTARYKARIVDSQCSNRELFVDLTGGFGVDFYFMSQGFKQRVYVEQNTDLCAIVENNMRALSYPCFVRRGTASAYLTEMPRADVVYLDPARRNEYGGRTYGIEDCTPNVLELLPLLMEKADKIVLKLSPMLDWHKAVKALKCVTEVHIVSVDNECKELLLVLSKDVTTLRLFCVNNDQVLAFFPSLRTQSPKSANSESEISEFIVRYNRTGGELVAPLFLYEPNASVMKAGCFSELEACFPIHQVSQNSHLFLSSDEIGHFPGRGFQVLSISSMNKKEINQKLTSMERANLAVRNFPLSVDQLRKKLKLKDGGDVFIFATTVQDGQHKLFICRKIS